MKTGTKVAIGAGVVAAGIGAYFLIPKKTLSNVGQSLSNAIGGCGSGTITGGIPGGLNPNYTPPSYIGGPSPGPSGQHAFPCLSAGAPQTLPVNGHPGGSPLTRA